MPFIFSLQVAVIQQFATDIVCWFSSCNQKYKSIAQYWLYVQLYKLGVLIILVVAKEYIIISITDGYVETYMKVEEWHSGCYFQEELVVGTPYKNALNKACCCLYDTTNPLGGNLQLISVSPENRVCEDETILLVPLRPQGTQEHI